MEIKRDQLAQFASRGFIKLSAAVSEDACHRMVRWTEDCLPAGWRSDSPDSWIGPIEDACHTNSLAARRGRLQYRVHELRGESVLVDSYGPGSEVAAAAEQLIGAPLGEVLLRGLYPIFPLNSAAAVDPFKKAHNEAHPSQLITITYLNDVEPGGGGLLVWPGSHAAIYPTMASKLEYVATPEYQRTYEAWTRLEPIELCGRKGDAIILHHRLLHSASVNSGPSVRFAFLCDYRRNDFRQLCREAPSSDLWEDWPAIGRLEARDRVPARFAAMNDQASSRPFVDARQKLKKRTGEANASTKRKGDASVLERLRTVGDHWLVLSDCELSRRDPKLFPRGNDLASQGTRMWVDGVLTESICQYDHFVEFGSSFSAREIRVENLQSPAWLRLVSTRLPLNKSDIRFTVELPPGTSRVTIDQASGAVAVEHGRRGLSQLRSARRLATALLSLGRPAARFGGATSSSGGP